MVKKAPSIQSLSLIHIDVYKRQQTTDVEIEVNGLMTYDRKVIKPDADRVRAINLKITGSLNK